MKKYYMPYNLDVEYERRTYKNVGRDYGNRKTANLGLAGNILRGCRKKKNGKEKRYAFCNTYSEWKEHIKGCIPPEGSCKKENFAHWIIEKKNDAEFYFETIKSVLIPCYIALISLYEVFWTGEKELKYIALVVTLLMLVVASTAILNNAMQNVKFYTDFINVVNEIDEENTKELVSNYNKEVEDD